MELPTNDVYYNTEALRSIERAPRTYVYEFNQYCYVSSEGVLK